MSPAPKRVWLKEPLDVPYPCDHLNEAAKSLLGITSQTWHWKKSECIDKTGKRDLGWIVIGSKTRLLLNGPRKGQKTWIGPEDRVVVTSADLREQYKRYELHTGACHLCYGVGKRAVGAGERGTCYENCTRCKGTGKYQPGDYI